MALVVYADFTSPWCYLASRRVDALTAAGLDVDWRAIEQYPHLPVTGRPLDVDGRAELAEQMATVTSLLLPGERLPWATPPAVSRTEGAVSGFAEGHGAGVASDVRRLLYTAYWVNGMDIGNPEILRKLLAGAILRGRSSSLPLRQDGYAVTPLGAPVTTGAWRRMRQWREEWTLLDTELLPVLVVEGEAPHSGEPALRRLEKELTAAAVELDPVLPDPARYPAPLLRPPMDWVSRVGGSWAHTWMPSPLKPPANR